VRDTSPDGDDRAFGLDSREWEEEQVRLDRDWYTGAEEGGVAGDEEHNPLSQYEDLAATKDAEIASKQIVRLPLLCRVSLLQLFFRRRFLQGKHNM
jgi:pre-mRNA-splicing factor ATP-dependent RNA helicase DHX38/PRP16